MCGPSFGHPPLPPIKSAIIWKWFLSQSHNRNSHSFFVLRNSNAQQLITLEVAYCKYRKETLLISKSQNLKYSQWFWTHAAVALLLFPHSWHITVGAKAYLKAKAAPYLHSSSKSALLQTSVVLCQKIIYLFCLLCLDTVLESSQRKAHWP